MYYTCNDSMYLHLVFHVTLHNDSTPASCDTCNVTCNQSVSVVNPPLQVSDHNTSELKVKVGQHRFSVLAAIYTNYKIYKVPDTISTSPWFILCFKAWETVFNQSNFGTLQYQDQHECVWSRFTLTLDKINYMFQIRVFILNLIITYVNSGNLWSWFNVRDEVYKVVLT